MPKINILREDLINKIAAGEVVERPAAVVKELIENSLDANSTRIEIDIEDSGKKLIKVTDNGEGMDEEDVKKCYLRHTTSKIKEVNDLFAINTLGFRGEALASIAAVSQLSVVTKQKDLVEGINIVLEGGQLISSGILATGRGTSVEVRNLFFNTPARKKFLKSDPVELRHIVEVVIRYALINPEMSFQLRHEGHQLLNSPQVEDSRDNISSVYGVNVAKDLLEVDHQQDSIKVYGYIVKPHLARNDKTQQALFVNRRWVRNEYIMKAIYDAYHSLLFVNKHPIVVLNVNIDVHKIDVNVHPTKELIKIEQKDEVYQAVYNAVKETLQKNNLIPVVDVESDHQLSFGTPMKKMEESTGPSKYSVESGRQTVFRVNEESAELEALGGIDSVPPEGKAGEEGKVYGEESTKIEMGEEYASPEEEIFQPEPARAIRETIKYPTMRLLGQMHKTFFIAETFGGLYYIDQHAAHERVLYERFMKQYMDRGIEVQRLLRGGILEFSPAEKLVIKENSETLEKLGFSLEEFGDNSYLIKTIPLLFGKTQPKEIIYEVLSLLKEGKHKLAETKEEVVTRMACRAAVMGGDVLTIQEMEKIIKELSETENPYTCPHGRPTMVKVTVDDLDKMFKRK